MSESHLPPIRVAPGGRYFETVEGMPFLFIGPNDGLTWPGLAPLFLRRDLAAADAYLESLARSGVTILRLMLEYVHREGRYFERQVGQFNPRMVRLWDDLFAACERHGLRVLLAPWDNFWMARRWYKHPYNVVNGGPASSPASFFTDEATIVATERRLCFVAERWGGSGALAAWDLFNEIHPYWGGTPAQQAAVVTRLSDAVRRREQACWGFTRPQTVSIFGPSPSPEYEDLIFRHPNLDFATTHIYEGAIDDPKETITPALTMARWVRHALERVPAGRPFLDTEHGPIHRFNDHRQSLPEAFDNEYERHLMWAHLASGGAGSGMRWPARHPHLLTSGMYAALSSLAAFSQTIRWSHFTPHDAVDDVSVEAPNIHRFACRDESQAIVWLLRDTLAGGNPSRLSVSVPLHLRGLRPGNYTLTLWDTQQTQALAVLPCRVTENRRLTATLPAFASDLAAAVTPCVETPANG